MGVSEYHNNGWTGVDFDGTLSEYHGYRGPDHCGDPIMPMIELVKELLRQGEEVRVFTARIYPINMCVHAGVQIPEHSMSVQIRDAVIALKTIQRFCLEHIGEVLPVTNVKDPGMKLLYDDRCLQVEENTGRTIG